MSVDLEKIREIAERVAASEGLALVDVELKGGRVNPLLRVYIDKPSRTGQPGGVSHGDCELISEQLSAILDVEDPFPARYTLEVSSPGLDRKLTRPGEYAHFVGRRVRLVLRDPVDEQKVLEGSLAGYEDGRVRLDLGEKGLREFELENISKAQLIVEI
jgi:ribosome maturation factor RimP